MQVKRVRVPVTKVVSEAVVVGIYSDHAPSGAAGQIDKATSKLLRRLIDAKEVTGKACELTPLWGPAGCTTPLVLLAGLGARDKFDCRTAYQTAAAAARYLAGKSREKVAFYLGDGWPEAQLESAVCGAVVGCQGQDLYRAEKKRHPFGEILWGNGTDQTLASGQILGESVNLARRLVNEPPQEIYPESFARHAADVAGETGLEIEVWDEDRLHRERAGSLLAVAKGSSRPPRLVILKYSGAPAAQAPLALVGKGVTFDSGGLSLKPNDSMKTMKCDMAGAATVLGAMRAIARLRLPINVLGLMGLVENMPSGDAMKLGDVLKARNGKTIEVLNTDAEGRLVLADVLDVAVERGATRIVDLATLTGSCVVALGTDVAGLMTNDQAWCDTVSAAAQLCGEALWQLPMFPEYAEHIKSEVADIRNVGDGRWGGAIAAAKFLEEFVGKTPWAHLDIAGPAFLEKTTAWSDGGATGVFVRTLVEIARGLSGEA